MAIMWLSNLAHMLGYVPYVVAAVVLWVAIKPVNRFRYRHIPGPFARPFLGNLIPIVTKGQHIYFTELRAKYGPIFQVWYCGEPWVVISDADTVRRVASRLSNRWMPPHTLLGLEKQVLHDTLVLQPSGMWKLLKKAWDPALLHRSSLEGYAPVMQDCIDGMIEQLEGPGQQGAVVDIYEVLHAVTLDIVGLCAFGIRFAGGASARSSGWEEEGAELLSSVKGFFRSQELDNASKWVLPVLMMPSAARWFRGLAYLLPDAGHTSLVQSMRHTMVAARKIIAASRTQRQAAAALSDTGARDQGMQGQGTTGKGVLPGSFVAQLEAWKDKHEATDGRITDDLVAAQVITFLLGGYETISATLAFLIHDLAVNPEAQQKLQQELEAVLGGRKPTLDDLPKLVYLEACLKETMRLGGSTPYIGRKYDAEGQASVPHLRLLGYTIPGGTNVCMYTHSLHRDSQLWERPEEFLPERFLLETGGKLGPFHGYAYLPFGMGGRKCVGYKFAEQEMALVAAALLRRFSFSLPAGAGPLRKKMGLTLSPDGGLPVHVHRR